MVGVNPEFAHEQMAGLSFFHAVAQALEAGKLFHIDLNDQKPGRFDQDLRFGSESIKPLFFLVKLLEEQGYDGPRHFDAHAYRTEDDDGRVGLRARLHAHVSDPQGEGASLRRPRGHPGAARRDPRRGRRARRLLARQAAAALKAEAFDRQALASRRLPYERLDQLVIDLLLGAVLMASDGALYLGLDCQHAEPERGGARSRRGDRHRVVCELSLPFDETLPHYGTRHGVLPNADPSVAQSSPVMWAEALDVLFARLTEQRLDLCRLDRHLRLGAAARQRVPQ